MVPQTVTAVNASAYIVNHQDADFQSVHGFPTIVQYADRRIRIRLVSPLRSMSPSIRITLSPVFLSASPSRKRIPSGPFSDSRKSD
ncbi:hypothetical protein F2Q69_00011165 [Brassica cretica]|uniref:Uncharacterized protein n=1 Tax=Brassica cretica TaxID=69181 RepID=A0A8S9QVG0_BRACR|nr:hypothetical protein F2Q69_00011165 [Brassica cretica]